MSLEKDSLDFDGSKNFSTWFNKISKRNYHNPYNQLSLNLDTEFSNQEELENARDEIQKAYYEENEETKDGKGKLTK